MKQLPYILALSAALIAAPSFAGPGKAKRNGPNPSASAFEHANENARFKRDDWSSAKRQADSDEKGEKDTKDKKNKEAKKAAGDDEDEKKRTSRQVESKDSEKRKSKDGEVSAETDEPKTGKRRTDGRAAARR